MNVDPERYDEHPDYLAGENEDDLDERFAASIEATKRALHIEDQPFHPEDHAYMALVKADEIDITTSPVVDQAVALNLRAVAYALLAIQQELQTLNNIKNTEN